MDKNESAAASARYLKAWNGYKKSKKENPDLSLKAYCVEVKMNYDRMINWTCRHGLYVSSLKAGNPDLEAPLNGGGDNPAFVQFVPRQGIESSPSSLRGVSITFPDGVNLTLQECTTESVISLLTIYQQRKAEKATATDTAQGGAE